MIEAWEIYEEALKEILRIHERHVDDATMRRSKDFREAMEVAREALKRFDALPKE